MQLFPVTAAVEGVADEAALRRLAAETGVALGPVHVTQGKHQLDRRLGGFNAAARHNPWLILRDLDDDDACAPSLVSRLVPAKSELLWFRVAVRCMESWLLADRENLARFLSVSVDLVPGQPESIEKPKREMISLARRSRREAVRRDMVPDDGVSAPIGPGYNAHVIEFISRHWDPDEAAKRSDSLSRCLRTFRHLARG